MNKKIIYRIIISALALLAIAGTLFSYAGHAVNVYYFPDTSHTSGIVWIAIFSLLSIMLSIEAVILVVFKRTLGRPNQSLQPTPTARFAAGGRG